MPSVPFYLFILYVHTLVHSYIVRTFLARLWRIHFYLLHN